MAEMNLGIHKSAETNGKFLYCPTPMKGRHAVLHVSAASSPGNAEQGEGIGSLCTRMEDMHDNFFHSADVGQVGILIRKLIGE